MLLIRRTEELILQLFTEGKVSGTTHTCIGQEANAIALISQLDPAIDFVMSNHRCHGHYLSFGCSLEGLLGEIMGRANGICGGRGGSQHLKSGNFFSNGVLGGGAAIACGLALGEKLKKQNGIAVWCLSDGALGEGVVYESLNMAALWNLPILFFVENNLYAQSTPIALGVAGSVVDRAKPFGIHADEIDTTDVEQLRPWCSEMIEYVRTNRKPAWAVVDTYRLAAHSKGDDNRPEEELARHREHDPLYLLRRRVSDACIENAEKWVEDVLAKAAEAAENSPASTMDGELS